MNNLWGFVAGIAIAFLIVSFNKPDPSTIKFGEKSWAWGEKQCAERGGIKAFKIVRMRYVTVVCGDGEGVMMEAGI